MTAPSLREHLDPRVNGINLIRLVLAASVVFAHAHHLAGREVPTHIARQLFEQVNLDGFFVISGYLLASSWASRPDWVHFMWNRSLRIYPGFWACLVVVAFGFAPLFAWLRDIPFGFTALADGVRFVASNATLHITQKSVGGTPSDVPFPGVWNGSLWTLQWEFWWYLAIVVLGLAGAFRSRRHLVPLVFVLSTLATVAISFGAAGGWWVESGVRFAHDYSAGMLLFLLRDRLRVRPSYVVLAAGVVLGSTFLPDYRAVGLLPLAYLVIAGGGYMRRAWMVRHEDFSYGTYVYAFPIQQVLAATAAVTWAPLLTTVITLLLVAPLAVLSWFLVEKPALRLKRFEPRSLAASLRARRTEANA